MTYFPKDKKVNFYLINKEKVNLSFAQVDYLCNEGKPLFLNIDYYSMMQNCQVDKDREYKENCIDMTKIEKYIKEVPILKGNEINILYTDNGYEQYKKELKHYLEAIKSGIKNVVTNNKDYFNELFA